RATLAAGAPTERHIGSRGRRRRCAAHQPGAVADRAAQHGVRWRRRLLPRAPRGLPRAGSHWPAGAPRKMNPAHRAARSLAGVPPAQGERLMPSYSQDDVVRWLTGQTYGSLDLTEDNAGLAAAAIELLRAELALQRIHQDHRSGPAHR